MSRPEPLYVRWRGTEVRIRHDDPRLTKYDDSYLTLASCMTIVSDVEGLRRKLATTRLGDRYDVDVLDDGSEVRMRRRQRHYSGP